MRSMSCAVAVIAIMVAPRRLAILPGVIGSSAESSICILVISVIDVLAEGTGFSSIIDVAVDLGKGDSSGAKVDGVMAGL